MFSLWLRLQRIRAEALQAIINYWQYGSRLTLLRIQQILFARLLELA